ncbi:MAG TPA: tRNA (adenosine(37)-N6)-threonylcarbamoyltransferase complex ATPase subunit type 1 TsaE [Caulobacteraceae bacterium]|nr:tRNA (adenosine(37)-N6)-threonylcarbamoyltransferase complex ATPase subunit type 1 TsaE [Caulobacteraceae bacterium]
MILPAEFRLDQEADTRRLGAAIARALGPHEAICLTGPLGAGKSTLARGLIFALAPETDEAPSPSFTLVQTYAAHAFAVAHFDLYRIEGDGEIAELGLDEALDDGAVVVEWAEKLGRHLPMDRLDVVLAIDGEARRARLTPHGAWQERSLEF